jgi:carboxyl-terminal processing protease
MKGQTKYLVLYLAIALAIGIILGTYINFKKPQNIFTTPSPKDKIDKLIDFINSDYVDKVNADSIVDLTVTKILEKLDPHSVYIPPIAQTQIAESMRGDFIGIGVNFYMLRDTVAIIKPVEGGPSAKAGILPGDRILYANKEQLFGRKYPSDSLFSKLKGAIGSEVTLEIYRKSEAKKFKIKLKRDVIPIKSVDMAAMVNPKIGYIKINRFAETTYNEFKTGLMKLKKLGATTLVIDVRDNGGGYMEKAASIADEFLKNQQLIVYTKNKKERIDKIFATSEGQFEQGKVVVLINENSASASEILAGAIQDNDRGLVIGRRSFGKGLVQREMYFSDGSAVRLTVARYYTPSGRSIQKSYKKGNEDYNSDFDKRIGNGELYRKDSIKVADTLKFKTPKGRIVYGGGGIVPDVFIPLEAESGNEGIIYLMQSGIVSSFVFEELDKKRQEFKGLTLNQTLAKLDNSTIYVSHFQEYLSKNGLVLEFYKDKSLVKRYLNAEFVRQLYGEEKYYELILKEDPMIKEVIRRN